MSASTAPRELVVVGAGAAGLWAAETAARAGLDVLLLEKTPRTGTKVLASGGTKCNLTTTLGPEAAAALFGDAGARFLRTAFRTLPPTAVRERFAGWGVATEEAPLEKVFPASGRARDVRDALEAAARGAGAEIRTGAPVVGLERDGDTWRVRLADGGAVAARGVVLCSGGRSYPRTGTTGDGYAWLAALGLPLVEPVPALAPLVSDEAWATELAGIAVQDCEATLVTPAGRRARSRRRPVLFTHTGLSGPAAMDLSEPVARWAAEGAGGAPYQLALDLAPEHDRDALRELLVRAGGERGAPRLSRALPVALPKRLLARIVEVAGLDEPDPRVASVPKGARHELVEALKGLRVSVVETRGYDLAEVTAGGLDLRAVDPGTCRVRGAEGLWVPNLWVVGELLDLQGPIGGLNFQAAFATAELAALDAAGARA